MALSILPSSQSSDLCINKQTDQQSDITLVEPLDACRRVAFCWGFDGTLMKYFMRKDCVNYNYL